LYLIKLKDTHTHTQTVGFLWMSDRCDGGTATWQYTTLTRRHPCLPAGFEPAIPASKRLHTHTLGTAAIGPAHL